MKNIRIFFYCLWVQFVCFAAFAQDGGRVLLDLRDDSPNEVFDDAKEEKVDDLSAVFRAGYSFVQDVKEYNDLLPGDTIDKDFSADMLQKYPKYNEQSAKKWQNYVRHGVKAYRFYDYAKQKVKDWIFNYELPITVADDQYEMGGDEEYIESDEPLVRYNFKKVIAYSNQEKDRLAAKEKLAKDNNWLRPSQAMKWYRENIAQGNWKKLVKGVFYENIIEQEQKNKEIKSVDLKYMIFLRNNGWDKQGNFDGVLRFVIPDGKVVPLSYYGDYKGLSIDFSSSENIDYVHTYLTRPSDAVYNDKKQLLFYAQSGDVYFKAKAKDINKTAMLRVNGVAPLCRDDICKKVNYNLELQINPVEVLKETSRGYYVHMISSNVPKEENAKKFKIHKVEWSDGKDGDKFLNVRFSANNPIRTKVFLLGENARWFSVPQIDLQKKEVSAKFKLLEKNKTDIKEVMLWLSEGSGSQYIAVEKISAKPRWYAEENKFNLRLLILAFVGGLSLNLFSGGALLLWSKLQKLSDFGGKNSQKIRTNWGWCSLGIIVIFTIVSLSGGYLKYQGINFIWGEQFSHVEFLMFLQWSVLCWGIIILRYGSKFPVMSVEKCKILPQIACGAWAAILGVALGGIYWNEFISIAWQISFAAVGGVLIIAGIGMVLPYGVIALFPKLVEYIPANMQWRKFTGYMLAITIILLIGWLVVLVYDVVGAGSTWLLVGSLLVVVIVLSLQKGMVRLIDRLFELEDKRDFAIKLANRIALSVVLVIVIGSFVVIQKTGDKTQKNELLNIKLEDFTKQAQKGQKTLLKVETEWCLLCRYNNLIVFGQGPLQDELENQNVQVIKVDPIKYNEQIKDFLQKFNFRSLPLYVLFSSQFVDGIVLPQRITSDEITELIMK